MSNSHRGPSIDASYHVWFIWQSGFREDFQKSTNQKQELPVTAICVNGSGRNEQSLQRTSHTYVDASYQVSVHLAKRFQRRRFFRNQPIRNKNCLWRPCFLMDQDEMSNIYRGTSIDASYQVSVHLTKWFQRRRFFKISQSETRIACGSHVC